MTFKYEMKEYLFSKIDFNPHTKISTFHKHFILLVSRKQDNWIDLFWKSLKIDSRRRKEHSNKKIVENILEEPILLSFRKAIRQLRYHI